MKFIIAALVLVSCAHGPSIEELQRRVDALEAKAELPAAPSPSWGIGDAPRGIYLASFRPKIEKSLLAQSVPNNCVGGGACVVTSVTATGSSSFAGITNSGAYTQSGTSANTLTGILMVPNGTAAAPSLVGTAGSSTTGLFWPSNGLMGVSSQAADTNIRFALNAIQAPNGTVSLPGFSFSAEPSTGFYRTGASQTNYAAQGTEIMRFPAARGAAGAVYLSGGVGVTDTFGTVDHTFCIYNTGNIGAATAFGETTFTHSATVDTGSKVIQDVVGVGAGNWVVKLCTDGTTCAAGNTFLTYTESCTAVAGTRTAATVQNSGAIPAAAVGTLSVTTACATTEPAANVCIHYTTP